MTESEINQLKEKIQNYATKKNIIFKKIRDIEDNRDALLIPSHIAEMQILDLYKELSDAQERIDFIEQSKKTENDVEFEKNFRVIFFEVFYNVHLDINRL